MSELAQQSCVPCRGDVPPLRTQEIEPLLSRLPTGWDAVNEHHLTKAFSFRNFREALAFTNAVGTIAEEQRHHPDVHLSWGRVVLEIWTHKIGGLTASDFILAAKCDAAYAAMKGT